MRRVSRYLNLVCLGWLTVATGGCAPVTPDRPAWIAEHGGLMAANAEACRAERALVRLRPALAGRVDVHVAVLNTRAPAAYSWPDGSIFVSRGLVDSLTDPELAGALAHELGHLCNDGHLQTVCSLRGCWTNPDAEARADATGVQILRASGIDPRAMPSMLANVRAGLSDAPACRQQIARRIAILSAADAAR